MKTASCGAFRRRRDSSPSEKALSGLIFDFELFWRTRGRLDTFTGRGDGVGLIRGPRRAFTSRRRRPETPMLRAGREFRETTGRRSQ